MKLKRRQNGKTDYNRRLSLLRSKTPRLVVRKRANTIIAQVVAYDSKGDRVLASAFSKELEKLGWPHSKKNIPAAYLTGLLCGKKASERQIKKAVLDVGLKTPEHGTRTYAVLKGAVDGGLEVACNESAFPTEERIKGKHIPNAKDMEKNFEKTLKAISGAHPKVVIGKGKDRGAEEKEKEGASERGSVGALEERQPTAAAPTNEEKKEGKKK